MFTFHTVTKSSYISKPESIQNETDENCHNSFYSFIISNNYSCSAVRAVPTSPNPWVQATLMVFMPTRQAHKFSSLHKILQTNATLEWRPGDIFFIALLCSGENLNVQMIQIILSKTRRTVLCRFWCYVWSHVRVRSGRWVKPSQHAPLLNIPHISVQLKVGGSYVSPRITSRK